MGFEDALKENSKQKRNTHTQDKIYENLLLLKMIKLFLIKKL